MSDPIKDLENFSDGGIPVNPLAPSEVRRLGTRMRRRRNATAAVASLAAVAVIATPFALFAGKDDASKDLPPANPSPSETAQQWLTEIPAAFPLGTGLVNPDTGEEEAQPVPAGADPIIIRVCGGEVWGEDPDLIARRGVEMPVPGAHFSRELLLLPDEQAAIVALEKVRAAYAECPRHPIEDPAVPEIETELVNTSVPGEQTGAEETFTATSTYANGANFADVRQFVRVGNAVAVTWYAGHGNQETIGDAVSVLTEASTSLAGEMQLFADPGAQGDLESMLLTEAETSMGDTGEGWWVATETLSSESTSDFLPCLGSLTDRGATAVALRLFAADGVDPTGEAPEPAWTLGTGLVSAVGAFPNAADARAAYDEFQADAEACSSAEFVDTLARTSIQGPASVGVDQDAAQVMALTFGPAGDGTEQWLEIGLAVEDNRVAIVSSVKRMPTDLDPKITPNSPIELMTANAAASIEPGSPEISGEGGGSLSTADLITPQQTVLNGFATWETRDTFPGDGQASPNPCFTQGLEDLGALAVFGRDFDLVSPADEGPVAGAWMTARVAEFPNVEGAAAAYDAFGQDMARCEERLLANGLYDRASVREPQVVETETDGEARNYSATFGPVEGDQYGDDSHIMESGMALVGNRVVLLSLSIVGQDYNYTDGTPMEQMLPVAATRLLPE